MSFLVIAPIHSETAVTVEHGTRKAKSHKDQPLDCQKADSALTSLELSIKLSLFQTICDSSMQLPGFKEFASLLIPALPEHHIGVREL